MNTCEFSGFYSGVNEVSICLGYDYALLFKWFLIIIRHFLLLKIRHLHCLEMLETNNPGMWHHIPTERIPHVNSYQSNSILRISW